MKPRSLTSFATKNGEAVSLIEYLYQGGRDSRAMYALSEPDLKTVRNKEDCADFRLSRFAAVLFGFSDCIPKDLAAAFREELLAFPYEDTAGHDMCTWTENHRLYIDGTEHLTALMFKNAVFADGKSAEEHLINSKSKLNKWAEHIEKYGYSEWGSNNYYAETLAGLSVVITYTEDMKLRARFIHCLDRLLYDIFSQTVFNGGYMYNPACSRAYHDNKTGAENGNYIEKAIRMFLGERIIKLKDKETCVALLLDKKDENGKPVYTLPEEYAALLKIPDREVRMRQGLLIKDYRKEGLRSYSPENVRYALESGAVSDARLICNNVRYLKETGLICGGMLKPLKSFAKPLLYRTGLLRLLKSFVNVVWDSSAMEEGRIYTYTDLNYSVSVLNNYRVSKPSFQQNSLAVNLSYRISLFVSSPFRSSEKSGSPGYWIGSALTPRTFAEKNVAAALFDMKKRHKGLGFTHLYFPTGLFDDIDLSELSEGKLYARTMGVNVFVKTNPGVFFRDTCESLEKDNAIYADDKIKRGFYDREYDLINRAEGVHYYLFEVDNKLTFDDFRKRLSGSKTLSDGKRGTLRYNNGEREFSFNIKRGGSVNGEELASEKAYKER